MSAQSTLNELQWLVETDVSFFRDRLGISRPLQILLISITCAPSCVDLGERLISKKSAKNELRETKLGSRHKNCPMHENPKLRDIHNDLSRFRAIFAYNCLTFRHFLPNFSIKMLRFGRLILTVETSFRRRFAFGKAITDYAFEKS